MRKIMGVFLVMCMLFTMVPIYADDVSEEKVIEIPETDGSSSSEKWFKMFDSLLDDKINNGDDFYEVLDSLRDAKLEDQIEVVFNALPEENQKLLSKYGFNTAKIHDVMEDYFDSYPDTMTDVALDAVRPNPNIYSEIFHDEDLLYGKYMVKFQDYLYTRFLSLPSKIKDSYTDWDVRGVGEIHLNQDILNSFIEDEIFFIVDDRVNGVVTKNMYARPILEDIVRVKIKSFTNNTISDGDADEFAKMYYLLANVMLESAEANLKDTNKLDKAIALARFVDLVDDRRIDPEDDPDPVEDPSILIVPDLGTIYYNPDTGSGESDELQYDVVVGDSNSDVVWSINNDGDIVTIDSSGNVQLNPEYIPNAEDSQINFTITAKLEDDTTIRDTARLELVINPLGAPDFLGAYITGYEDQTFRGKNAVTREEMVTMFVRVMKFDIKGYEEDANGTLKLNANNLPIPIYYDKTDFMVPSYNDVAGNDWSYLYVEIAKEKGWFPADEKGNFNPKTPIKRGEIPMVMIKVWNELEIPVDQLAKHYVKDVPLDHEYFHAIQAFYNEKIVTGYEDGTYRPEDVTTRNEIVSMINKIINRPKSLLGISRFSDVAIDHWALGDIEAATQIQLITQTITEQ